MLPFEIRAMIILLADAVLNANSTEEIYELLAKTVNVREVILEPYRIAKEKKEKNIPVRYKTAKERNARKAADAAKEKDEEEEEAKWPYFPEEIIRFF